MLKRVLIANRGEIALRILRACREIGMETMAVYSEADADALHVQLATQAVCIGPAPAAGSYLNREAILTVPGRPAATASIPGMAFSPRMRTLRMRGSPLLARRGRSSAAPGTRPRQDR